MSAGRLIQLAQDLEWLGCELEYQGHRHALEGFPGSGPAWQTFVEKQRGVLSTCDKLERELKDAVRYNLASLVGVDYPLEARLDAVTHLLGAAEDIRQTTLAAVHDLPSKVREFHRLVREIFAGGRVPRDE